MSDGKPQLVPITDPHELRDRTVRDYMRAARRMGAEPLLSDVERLAVADMTLVDNYERGIDHTRGIAKAKEPRKTRAPVIADPSDPLAARLKKGPQTAEFSAVLHAAAFLRGEKWAHAMGRIERILEGATPASDLKEMAKTATHPKCALAFLRLWAAFLLRRRRSRHNPFLGLSDRDAARKMEAEVYNICDRSANKLGPWWVPK